MNQQLDKIKKNLYELETILSTETIIKLLSHHAIDTQSFLTIVQLYLKYFENLKNFTDELLIQMLDEKLDYFVENSQDGTRISLYHAKLSASVTFIQDKSTIFLNLNERVVIDENKYPRQNTLSSLQSIHIKNFFSIKDLLLSDISAKKEIYIVGENGDGKTLLLQAIAIGLKGVEEGDVFDIVKSQTHRSFEIKLKDTMQFDIEKYNYQNFFAYGSNRNNSCKMDKDKSGYLTLFNSGLDLYNPIEWLKGLYNAEKSGVLKSISLIKAKEILKEILNRDISIEVTHDKVVFKEKGSLADFEQLSAGYKSVIIIICDLIARLSELQKDVKDTKDFQGIVLVDEVELHLHPKWKYDFVHKLREIFPNMQFVFTTHSPTVILGASKEAVFYKIYKENGEVCISEQIENKGFTNNTLISSPLFNLDTMASRDFDNSKFSSDDFVYQKIHERVSKKIHEENIISDDEISQLIDTELEKL